MILICPLPLQRVVTNSCVVISSHQVELLLGDPTKAKKVLGWTPEVSFDELVKEMVDADLDLVAKGDMTS